MRLITERPPWRNGIAHWTSNSKVVGSSPTGGDSVFLYFFPQILIFLPTDALVRVPFQIPE